MNPYERLAQTLDKIPSGFPAALGGEHLRLLEWIFTPEEADLASKMKLKGGTVEEVAGRLGMEIKPLRELLEGMAKKGQIGGYNSKSGVRKYALMPFVVGIYEEQLGRMDAEMAALFEDYYNAGFQQILTTPPSGFKVIPVNKAIDTSLEVFTSEKAEELIRNAKSLGVRDCICKKQQSLLGNDCKYPRTVCLLVNPERENAYEEDELTRSVSRDEALQLLRESEDAGLVHCSLNVEDEKSIRYICNCCTCCCGFLRGVSASENPRDLVRTDYLTEVDDDLCIGCEFCVERCQMGALDVVGSLCTVDVKRCIGCGVCAESCPEGALHLTKVPSPGDHPESLMDWMVQRATHRGVDPSDLL